MPEERFIHHVNFLIYLPCPAGEVGFSHTDLKSQPEISEQVQFYPDFDLTYREARRV